MSTFLQLAQRLRQETGVPGVGPTTVTGNIGELQRLISWTQDAWRSIQSKHQNWRWMRRSFTVTTTTGVSEYASGAATDTTDAALISRFSRWIVHDDYGLPTFTIYTTALGVANERRMVYMHWDYFRTIYRLGTQTNGTPAHFSITPANKIALGPAPDATGYTVKGDYQMSAQELVADATTPDMPTRFHMLIVYGAMLKYAGYEAAGDVYAIADKEYGKMMGTLLADQIPQLLIGEPLA